jgi:hypothetical protein
LLNNDCDISDLGNGLHTVHVKIVSAAADGIVYNGMIDALLIKG